MASSVPTDPLVHNLNFYNSHCLWLNIYVVWADVCPEDDSEVIFGEDVSNT